MIILASTSSALALIFASIKIKSSSAYAACWYSGISLTNSTTKSISLLDTFRSTVGSFISVKGNFISILLVQMVLHLV